MKTIKNITTELPKEDGFVTTADLIKSVINVTPKDGFDIDEMRKRFRIADVCDKANGSIKLEDNDFNHLQGLVKAFRWGVMHKDIIKFTEQFD